MKVILVRQGKTTWDEEERLQGTIEVPLSERGRKETATLARRLERFKPKRVFCGSGQTQVETARILARTIHCRVRRYCKLNALDYGLWQGMLLDELKERYPRTY